MDRPTTFLTLMGIAVALGGCNAPDSNRTTKAPPGAINPTAVTQPLVTASAPPAPAERGPVAANANTVAPGTDASVAFAHPTPAAATPQSKPAIPEKQGDAKPAAQEAAAKAPDTAAADAAKEQTAANPSTPESAATARDTSANSPRHGDLTKQEESNQLPKAGQANNHSSTALEKDSGR